jgi:hypothetical protein
MAQIRPDGKGGHRLAGPQNGFQVGAWVSLR